MDSELVNLTCGTLTYAMPQIMILRDFLTEKTERKKWERKTRKHYEFHLEGMETEIRRIDVHAQIYIDNEYRKLVLREYSPIITEAVEGIPEEDKKILGEKFLDNYQETARTLAEKLADPIN